MVYPLALLLEVLETKFMKNIPNENEKICPVGLSLLNESD